MAESIMVQVVRSETGSVDVQATVDNCTTALASYIRESEEGEVLCQTAVDAVFDQHKGAAINMPALVSLSQGWINTNVGVLKVNEYVPLGEKIGEYVRNHKDLYQISKGPKGGVRRISDLPVKA